jgi:hypothetical protein
MGSANFKLPPDQASPTFAHISLNPPASMGDNRPTAMLLCRRA